MNVNEILEFIEKLLGLEPVSDHPAIRQMDIENKINKMIRMREYLQAEIDDLGRELDLLKSLYKSDEPVDFFVDCETCGWRRRVDLDTVEIEPCRKCGDRIPKQYPVTT